VQLRRGGSDAEWELEAEAWVAAKRAAAGLPFYICLGSDRPLAATALVAVDGKIGETAIAHYQRFQADRLVAAGGIPVTTVTRVSPVALDELLDAIVADFPNNQDKSFVLCAHGNKDGLIMPVVGKSAYKANTTTLRFLMQPMRRHRNFRQSTAHIRPPLNRLRRL
jgi:hypothetical protein